MTSRKTQSEDSIQSAAIAEILAAQLRGSGDIELASRLDEGASLTSTLAERQAAWHEQAVAEVSDGILGTLSKYVADPTSRPLSISPVTGRREQQTARLYEARITETRDEGIERFYDRLGIGEQVRKTKFHGMTVLNMGTLATEYQKDGLIDKGSVLARRSKEGRKDPLWRVKTRTVSTGMGFSICETRFSSSHRRARALVVPDVVEIDVVFDLPKKR